MTKPIFLLLLLEFILFWGQSPEGNWAIASEGRKPYFKPCLRTLRGTLTRGFPTRAEVRDAFDKLDQTLSQWHGAWKMLTSRHPPEKHVYVGVGRSPAPLIGFALESGHGSARNLPFGKIFVGDGIFGVDTATLQGMAPVLERVFEDLDQLGGRDIVLIDYAVTGKSLYHAAAVLQHWLKSKNYPGKIKLFALENEGAPGYLMERNAAGKLPPFEYSGFIAPSFLINSNFEGIAEYPKFVPGYTPISDLQPRPEFAEARRRIKAWLKIYDPDSVKLPGGEK